MEYSTKDIKRKLKALKRKYEIRYGQKKWDYIERHFSIFIDDEFAPHELKELYDEMGLDLKYGNYYETHLQKLKDNFDISQNILEVGGGHIPSFAKKVAKEQLTIGKGTITVYDPLLVQMRSNIKNMHLHRTSFNSRTRIKEFDLIVGIYPCEATETMLESACINRKDFYLAICDCYRDDPEYWKYLIAKAERLLNEYDNGKLVVDTLGDSYYNKTPILYNRKNR